MEKAVVNVVKLKKQLLKGMSSIKWAYQIATIQRGLLGLEQAISLFWATDADINAAQKIDHGHIFNISNRLAISAQDPLLGCLLSM